MTLVKAMTSGFLNALVFCSRKPFPQKTIALGKPDVDLFITRTDTRHATDTTYQPSNVTVPMLKAAKSINVTD